MINRLRFYLRHSFNDLRVNGQRTFFALLCIAAGVAAIVSLQTVAIMIESTLQGNLQANNRGDIQIQPGVRALDGEALLEEGVQSGFLSANEQGFMGASFTTYTVAEQGLEQFQAWIDASYPGQISFTYRQQVADMASIILGGGSGGVMTNPESGVQASQLTPVMVDVAVYPLYSEVLTLDGRTLAEAIQSPTDVVLDEQVARALDVGMGDTVRISGTEQAFTVAGIVETAAEVRNPAVDALLALFGYYYLDLSAVDLFSGMRPQAERLYLQIAPELDVLDVEDALLTAFPYVRTTTTEDLRRTYATLSENIDQLVSVMGLVSLLIGSIGIVNTMQVIVRRRTTEVAVLKTIGLQSDQITILFLTEALLMGLIGSLAGIVMGWGATFIIRGTAERVLATELPFVLAPGPALNGLVVGILVTTIFGFLPTLTAGQVRPATILRPNEFVLPRTGCLATLGALGLVLVGVGLVASALLGSPVTGFVVTVGAFMAAGMFYVGLWLLITLIGRFMPSFGLVDLKIALRQMLAGRGRAAITLLALVAGVFSLSLITLLADSINNVLNYALTEGTGGNLIVTVASPQTLPRVETVISETPGLESYRVSRNYGLELVSVTRADGRVDDIEALEAILDEAEMPFFFSAGGGRGPRFSRIALLRAEMETVEALEAADLPEVVFAAGGQITADDLGDEPGIVLTESDHLRAAGVQPGDRITYAFDDGAEITFRVVGLVAASGINLGAGSMSPVYTLMGAFPASRQPSSVIVIVDIAEENVQELRQRLGDVPGTFALETAVINRFLENLLGTFTAFPSLVAALGLVVGGVVIANSVALTTMERRREIAVMKAVGLQRERVLGMILLENAVLGLIGGLIGVGVGLLALVLLVATFSAPGSVLPVGTALLLMLVCVLVALTAAITTAWGASGERPLNVLRYE